MRHPISTLTLLLLAANAPAEIIPLLQQPGAKLFGGVPCGGQHKATYVTGFNNARNITGELFVTTSCSTGARGRRPKRYKAWYSLVLDVHTGKTIATLPYDGVIPDPQFTATDAAGNKISTLPRPQPWPLKLYGHPAVLDKPEQR